MHRMQRDCLMAGFLVWVLLGSQPSEAQYTANFQTNMISGVTSNWAGSYIVGNTNFADALLIQSAGVQLNSGGDNFVGYASSGSNNSVVVSGAGSAWSNHLALVVGRSGAGNSLVISNGGHVHSFYEPIGYFGSGFVGYNQGSSNNFVLSTDTGSVWSNDNTFSIGSEGSGNSLIISNGGQMVNGNGYIGGGGLGSGGKNNSVLVTGPGSVWDNNGVVDVGGGKGSSNSLTIANGGQVISTAGLVGDVPSGDGVLVRDSGSVWSITSNLVMGFNSRGNSLVISNGGQVVDSIGTIGYTSSGSNNSATVTGNGSVWSNGTLFVGEGGEWNSLVIGLGGSFGGRVISSNAIIGSSVSSSSNSVRVDYRGAWQNNTLVVGDQGSSNSLRIGDGSVSATNLVVGAASTTCDNVVEVDVSGKLVVTNAAGTGVLEVRHGKLILNGGLVWVDTLVMTNPCAQFIDTGGTLIVGNVVLDPNTFRIVSVARQSNDLLITWMMGPGATNALQATASDGSGGYSTNGFTDIFIVTNNTTVGTVTNYLDIGAATNIPSRFYRARLSP